MVVIKADNVPIQHSDPHYSGPLICICLIGPPVLHSLTKHDGIRAVTVWWSSVRRLYRPGQVGMFMLKEAWYYYPELKLLLLYANACIYFNIKNNFPIFSSTYHWRVFLNHISIYSSKKSFIWRVIYLMQLKLIISSSQVPLEITLPALCFE